MSRIGRREFLKVLGASAVMPHAAGAQPAKTPRIGILVLGNPNPDFFWKMLRTGLQNLGCEEGRNIVFEFRSAEGKAELLPQLAAALVQLKVDVLVAYQTPAAQAAKQSTTEIPVVVTAGDPVGTGLVASLAHPGGNVTGLSGTTHELGGKSLELIREVVHSARSIAVLVNASDPFAKPFLEQLEQAAPALSMSIRPLSIRSPDDLGSEFAEIDRDLPQAVVVQPSLIRRPLIDELLKRRLPAISANRLFAEWGGLMCYAPDLASQYREVASYVDKVLKGSKPADLPVAQPTKFELVINLKTAKALGITMPPILLARADEVIE